MPGRLDFAVAGDHGMARDELEFREIRVSPGHCHRYETVLFLNINI
jgi:hypothetical protein